MDRPPAPVGVSPEEWARTPETVLRFFLGELEAQLRQHSQNSSRPPSSDPPSAPGGQPGHPGAHRALKPPDEVEHVEIVRPEHRAGCGQRLGGDDSDPVRHQVTELPQPRAATVEYQVHRLACPACGTVTTPPLPPGVPTGAFGPRLQAIVGLPGGRYQLSDRQWTFAQVPGVDPTNNAAERTIRPAVLWRKRSGGTQSAAGSRFVERLLTTVTTLRQQRRDGLAYLTAACDAANHGRPAPSPLPAAPGPTAGRRPPERVRSFFVPSPCSPWVPVSLC